MAGEPINETVGHWCEKAEHDLIVAERELKNPQLLTDIICFHCQQAGEKYLKAYLVSKEKKPKRTHDIRLIIMECADIDASFHILEDTVFLTNYAIESRYPDDYYMPEKEEAQNAYVAAIKIKNLVLQKIK